TATPGQGRSGDRIVAGALRVQAAPSPAHVPRDARRGRRTLPSGLSPGHGRAQRGVRAATTRDRLPRSDRRLGGRGAAPFPGRVSPAMVVWPDRAGSDGCQPPPDPAERAPARTQGLPPPARVLPGVRRRGPPV